MHIRRGKNVTIPEYSFTTHTRTKVGNEIAITPIVLVEGMLLYADDTVCQLLDLRLFVEASNGVRFRRRIARDTQSRGRTVDSVTKQWQQTVEPMFEMYVEPTRAKADLILPWNSANHKILKILASAIKASALAATASFNK